MRLTTRHFSRRWYELKAKYAKKMLEEIVRNTKNHTKSTEGTQRAPA